MNQNHKVQLKTRLKLIWSMAQRAVSHPNEMAAILRGDYPTYLFLNCHRFAQEENNGSLRQREVREREVNAILNTPDGFYLGNMTPMQFVAQYPERYGEAIVAVRETIRERNGTSTGRAPISELNALFRAGAHTPFS